MADTSQSRRIRGRRLQQIREQMMWDNPLCHGPDSQCHKAGRIRAWIEIDHIEPLHKGGKDVPSNRQCLCDDCHKAKTIKDMGYRVKQRIGLDGYPVQAAA